MEKHSIKIEDAGDGQFALAIDTGSNAANTPVGTPPPAKPASSKRRSSSSDKYKEPPKERVDIVASGFRDVYGVLDAIVGMSVAASGREYPEGLLQLDEEKSQKLARALVQMNNSLPALAERVNKVSAPLTFFTVLLSDLAIKGAVVYAITKQPRNIINTSQPSQPSTTHHNSIVQ